MSALTQTEMLEAVVDEEEVVVDGSSSSNSAFVSRLISPHDKRKLYRPMTTPPHSKIKKDNPTHPNTTVRSNHETNYTKDLNAHICHQNKIIH